VFEGNKEKGRKQIAKDRLEESLRLAHGLQEEEEHHQQSVSGHARSRSQLTLLMWRDPTFCQFFLSRETKKLMDNMMFAVS
jgi:hypothetical protein